MSFVIVQHLSRNYESNLEIILGRSTAMPVVFLEEDTNLVANTVYIKSPNQEIEVKEERITLSPRPENDDEIYLPIDDFFFDLAEKRGKYGIAIVLSGMGSDGSRGIKAIKEQGGVVLVQSTNSAQFSGMPGSAIRSDVADFIGSPKDIANILVTYTEKKSLLKTLDKPAKAGKRGFDTYMSQVLEVVQSYKKIDFSLYRPSTIRRRIEKRLLIHPASSPEAYLQALREDPKELEILSQSFLIGVTRFFRDHDAFDILCEQIIPEITEKKKDPGPIRIWVPACSTGEEAYSIAMALSEHLLEKNLDLDFKVLASDLDPIAISTASKGLYASSISADVPKVYLSRYFSSSLGHYRVIPELREKVLFAVQNLLTDPPFIHIDLISCRNFLIYVNAEAQNHVISNFHFSLEPEGILFLGPSESLGRMSRFFVPINRRWKMFSRKALKNEKIGEYSTKLISEQRQMPSTTTPDFLNASAITPLNEVDMLDDQYARYLSDQFAPPGFFVNEKYEIRYINGALKDFFSFPKNHANFTLGKVLNTELSAMFRAAVDAILGDESETPREEISIGDFQAGNTKYSARIRRVSLPEINEKLAWILVEDLEEAQTELANGSDQFVSPNNLLERKISDLEAKLIGSQRRAKRLLSELEATNEELQTSNRELIASNEEMQSANEELQSVNEELHTVNQELQNKNDQLKTLNNDINQLLENTDIGTIFLDEDIIIRRFTTSVRKQFDLTESDIGRPLASFSSNIKGLDLNKLCRQVLQTNRKLEKEIVDDRGDSYIVRILPYRGYQGDRTIGLILNFIDITDLVEARLLLKQTAAKFEALLQNSTDTIMVVDARGRVQQINHWLEPEPRTQKIVGTYLIDLIENDGERMQLQDALRRALDEGLATKKILRISDRDNLNLYAEFCLLPGGTDEDQTEEASQEYAILIIRNVSPEMHEKLETVALLNQYRAQLKESQNQAGIMDLKGNIIDLNRSTQASMSTDDFIQKSVYDFLTDSGRAKIDAAFGALKRGSTSETVHYQADDLNLKEPLAEVTVNYTPLMINGEIVCVLVKNITDDAGSQNDPE